MALCRTDGEEALFDRSRGEVRFGRRFRLIGAERVFTALHEVGHARQPRWPVRSKGVTLAVAVLVSALSALLGGGSAMSLVGVALGVASQVVGGFLPEIKADLWATHRMV